MNKVLNKYIKRVVDSQKSSITCALYLLDSVVFKKLDDVFHNTYSTSSGVNWKHLSIVIFIGVFFLEILLLCAVGSAIFLGCVIPIIEMKMTQDIHRYAVGGADKCKAFYKRLVSKCGKVFK